MIGGAALVAALLFEFMPPTPGASEVQAGSAPLTLSVRVHGLGLDLERCYLRVTPLRHAEPEVEHLAELGPDGLFHVVGLADTDHCVELRAHSAPGRVLGRADFVRPGREPLLLVADLSTLPAATPPLDATAARR